MKKKLLTVIAGIALLLIPAAVFASVLYSYQVGTNPVNGYYLKTNGTTSTWAAVSGGSSSSTLVFAGNGILVNASGTNGYIIVNNGVTSTAGNWAGTWQGTNSTTFYLASNPSGYITTSTFNATGTPFYFPYWNASGTALSPTSTIFISSYCSYFLLPVL